MVTFAYDISNKKLNTYRFRKILLLCGKKGCHNIVGKAGEAASDTILKDAYLCTNSLQFRLIGFYAHSFKMYH